MSNLTAFLKGNAIAKKETEEYIVSNRFKDAEGNDVPLILRYLSPKEITKIQDSAIERGKKNKIEFKSDVMQLNLVVATIKEPDLLNPELQDSYGVKNPHDLINEMFTSAEYMELSNKCMKMQGLDSSFEDDVEEAKN